MNRQRIMLMVGGGLVVVLALWLGQRALRAAGASQSGGEAPMFEVDPFWPKPLPNHWLIGTSIGLWVDDQDNVWMVHRGERDLDANERGLELGTSECCATAPHVLAFDPEGNLVQAWGGPGQGYDWPENLHGIFVDDMGYVWLGASGAGDSHFLKFTRDGTFVQQYGRPNARLGQPDSEGAPTYTPDSNDPENFGRVAELAVDPAANEVYVADGYFNKRVAVVDATTGAIKRYWGAYGNRPDDAYVFSAPGPGDPQNPPQQFRGAVHCIGLSNEGLLYVCDRQANRVQVFTREGEFVREAFFAPNTLASGSAWDVAFSRDPEQRYLFIADATNAKVRVILRETMQEVTNFGDGGRQPGQFFGVHNVALDSQGNLYTTETFEGTRIQKFVNIGTGSVAPEQGTVWPAAAR